MTSHAPTSDPEHPSLWLFGATSAVGTHLLRLLRDRRYAVTAFTRTARTAWQELHPEVDWMQSSLEAAPAPHGGTTHIISLGPCDAFVEWLAQQSPSSSLRQVIAFGSTSADTKFDSASAEERSLARSLRQSEDRLAEQCARLGAAWTLLRPTLIYGGDDDLVARIGRIAARWHVYPRPIGPVGRALRQPVHAADLATAVRNAIDNPATFDRRFDLAGMEPLPIAALIRRAAKVGSRYACPLPLPVTGLLRIAGLAGIVSDSAKLDASALPRLTGNQVFDITPAREALGFAPRGFRPEVG